jgi:transcriptional regulator with XRE-family HTH domain
MLQINNLFINLLHLFLNKISTIVDKIIHIMNNVGLRIKKLRESKGVTQGEMASSLNITQSNYGRLEKDDKRLNVPKILKIAEFLDVSISQIFNEKSAKVINQSHNDSPSAYNVENLYQDNKQVYEQLNSALKEHIQHLEKEVEFLRSCVKS